MKRLDYTSIVPRIKVWESQLLNKGFFGKLIELDTLEEAVGSLQETSYNEPIDSHNFESGLGESYYKICSELKSSMIHTEIVDFVRLKSDYNNIKTLLKGKILMRDFSYMLNQNGTMDMNKLKDSFEKDYYGDLEDTFKECILGSVNTFEKTDDIQEVEMYIDRCLYAHQLKIVKLLESPFMVKYMQINVDLTNLKTVLRVKKMGKDKVFLTKALVDGGQVSLNIYKDILAMNVQDIPDKFLRTDYYKLVTDGIDNYIKTNTLGSLEKNVDNFIMKYVRDAKYISVGVEPVFAYLYAKEVEIKNLRIIFAAKQNNATSIIDERLRDSYV